ncbi:MAG: metalloregulator ArsR/SmtB family transcription factor [Gammaproteobacteria bacterium]|nr:metalloregulator ArsR/SmtB family transcription factor [Gammaproteobacteria bacterium]MDH4254614.1 metalloregulator ArsR/SmtB family transcription factor [Gammaproteobacteria bacterium]MDH5310976.1 metalloregulator ArsR/SmtB family transcription factor [Gammaproteobacteria bacterium]
MDAFLALADPTRRRIIESLLDGERAVGEIAADFDISGPAVSQHLKVLREAGIVAVRRDAQRRIYSLEPAGLDEVGEWLNRLRGFWNERLDELERALGKPS